MLGGMNGLDLAREINDRLPDIPVLPTTGYSASAKDAAQPDRIAEAVRF